MLNSIVILTFADLDWKCPFLGKFGPKNQISLFKMKFGIQSNLSMLIDGDIQFFYFRPEVLVLL